MKSFGRKENITYSRNLKYKICCKKVLCRNPEILTGEEVQGLPQRQGQLPESRGFGSGTLRS